MNQKVKKRNHRFFDELIVREFIGTHELQLDEIVRIPGAAKSLVALFGVELGRRIAAKQIAANQPLQTSLMGFHQKSSFLCSQGVVHVPNVRR